MIDYAKAKQTAQEINPSVDCVDDFGDAFVFYDSNAEDSEDNDIVILKYDGSVVSYAEYIESKEGNYMNIKIKKLIF